MKEMLILVILMLGFLAVIFLATAPGNHIEPSESETCIRLNLSSNSEVYHSSEEMELTATIETSSKAENLTIKVYGIKDSRGSYRIISERTINVEPPGSNETFAFLMPSCYGCVGVSPGEYSIVLEILRGGEVLDNCSRKIKLEK